MKHFLLSGILFSFCMISFAQEKKKPTSRKEQKRQRIAELMRQEEEGIIAYRRHFAVGFKGTTDGYGIFFEKGFAKSIRKVSLVQLEITERKHQKEEKQSNPSGQGSPLIYGKVNFFYPVKLGFQQQFLLGNKSNKNGVSITANVGGGLILGILRAYEVEVDKGGQPTYVRYDSPDSSLFINGPYYGGPTFGKGWNHLKVTPGLYIKPAVRFDYGRYNEMITAIETGLTAEYYTKKIHQMLYNKQRQFFFGAYVALVIGRRK